MNIFLTFFQQFIEFCNSPYLLIPLQIISMIVLSTIIAKLIQMLLDQKKFSTSSALVTLFLIPIFAIFIENITWMVKYAFPKTIFARTIGCLAWMIGCFKFHSFLLFIEQLTRKSFKTSWYHTIFFIIEAFLCLLFIVFHAYLIVYDSKHYLFNYLFYTTMLFWLISITPSIVTLIQKLSDDALPIVLKEQIKTLFVYFLFPHLICIILEFAPFLYSGTTQIIAFSNLGIIIITSSFYYCFKKIMQFRFLNLSDRVQAQPDIHISPNFKEAIEQINLASSENELEYITQTFFFEQFNTAKHRTTLYIRSKNSVELFNQKEIENFLNTDHTTLQPIELLRSHKILINHEIEFDQFYTNNPIVLRFAEFLKSIHCDIFIPIFNHKKLIGYITVAKDTTQEIYNHDQQNRMIVFAQFLAPALHLLQQQNIYTLLQESKEIKEQLYAKHQEIDQYKESIKKLLKDRIENHIGVIFFKNKHFLFKNQEAQKLLGYNPNLEPEHPTTATLINFAQQVEKFQTAQTTYLTTHYGSKLMISAMPHAQPAGGVLLIIRQPEATDIIKMQVDGLKDSSKRDYLLYLETTKAGQSINKLLPSNHEAFLNIKIQLLQASLQKGALLLEMHPDDITPIVEIIHQIGTKDTFHTIQLQAEDHDYTAKLFGINPLLSTQVETALLEKHNTGTLLIKNIEFFEPIAQQKLAYFIRYGIYTPLKSEQRKYSNARIICSTGHNLETLHEEGKIISELYHELKRNCLILPSLVTMDHMELSIMIDGFMTQILQESIDTKLTPLNYDEKDALIEKRIPSLFSFKQKIQSLMMLKFQEKPISSETPNTTKLLDATCPEIQLACKLGKHALKDIQLMTNLWKKLGSQTKIADLLGVNRSSVNRRCKDYNLI